MRRLHEEVPVEVLGLSGTFSGLPALLRRLRRAPSAFVLTNCATSACTIILFKMLGLFHGRLVFVESVNPSQALRYSLKAAFAYRLIQCRADAVVHLSRFGYSYAMHLGFSAKQSHYIPNIIPSIRHDRPVRSGKGLRLIAVGRLDVVKGYERLIESMPGLIKAYPGSLLKICGEGDQHAKLEALIEKLQLNSSVNLVGHVDNVPQLLADSDILVMTSYFEGMPNALIEALSARMPVISTACGGSVRRMMVELGAEKALVKDGPEFSTSLIAALHNAASGEINWDAIYDRFSRIHDGDRNFNKLAALCCDEPYG
jgi:glycosyltransferase involved in cell wall biosynthesis